VALEEHAVKNHSHYGKRKASLRDFSSMTPFEIRLEKNRITGFSDFVHRPDSK
jgi:hypothetical protein